MFKSDKAKNAGKFIVIMLCFAILFFLLLPFLEDPAHRAAAQNKRPPHRFLLLTPLAIWCAKYMLCLPNTHPNRLLRKAMRPRMPLDFPCRP